MIKAAVQVHRGAPATAPPVGLRDSPPPGAGDGNRGAASATPRAPRPWFRPVRQGCQDTTFVPAGHTLAACPAVVVYWSRDLPALTPDTWPVRAAPPTLALWTWLLREPKRASEARPADEGEQRT